MRLTLSENFKETFITNVTKLNDIVKIFKLMTWVYGNTKEHEKPFQFILMVKQRDKKANQNSFNICIKVQLLEAQ